MGVGTTLLSQSGKTDECYGCFSPSDNGFITFSLQPDLFGYLSRCLRVEMMKLDTDKKKKTTYFKMKQQRCNPYVLNLLTTVSLVEVGISCHLYLNDTNHLTFVPTS